MHTLISIIQNWFKNNTPKPFQIIGDIGLFAATISAFITGIPLAMQNNGLTPIILPAWLILINKYCILVGVMIKFISKFFGSLKDEGEISNQKS